MRAECVRDLRALAHEQVAGFHTNSYTGNTTIDAGTLSISADNNFGATTGTVGSLTLAGGTLETTATLTSARTVYVNAANTVQVDTGTTTLSGKISGDGSDVLTKTGTGTLVLSYGGNDFGGTTIDAGTLDIVQQHAPPRSPSPARRRHRRR